LTETDRKTLTDRGGEGRGVEIGDHLEVVEAQRVITVAAMAPARSSFPPMKDTS